MIPPEQRTDSGAIPVRQSKWIQSVDECYDGNRHKMKQINCRPIAIVHTDHTSVVECLPSQAFYEPLLSSAQNDATDVSVLKVLIAEWC